MGKSGLSKWCLFVAFFLIGAVILANPLVDLAKEHWAYQSLSKIERELSLANKGFGALPLAGGITRLDLGRRVQNVLRYLSGSNKGLEAIKPETVDNLELLLTEFAGEINILGTELEELEASMAEVRNRVANYPKQTLIEWPRHWMYREVGFSISNNRVYDPKTGKPIREGVVESEHPWEEWRTYNMLGTGGFVHWQFNSKLTDNLSVLGKINTKKGHGTIRMGDTITNFSGGSIDSDRVSVVYQKEKAQMQLGYFETNFSPFTMKKIWGRPTQLEGFYLQTAIPRQMQLKALAAQKDPKTYLLGAQINKQINPAWVLNYNWVMDLAFDEVTQKLSQNPFVASIEWQGSLGRQWRINGELAKSFAQPQINAQTTALELEANRAWPKLNLALNYRYMEKNFKSPHGYWGEEGYRPRTPDKYFTDLDEEYKFPNKQRLVIKSTLQLPRKYQSSFKHRTMARLEENPLVDTSTYWGVTTPELLGQLVATGGLWYQTSKRPDKSVDHYKNTFDLRLNWAPSSRLSLNGIYLYGQSFDRLEAGKVTTTEIKHLAGTYNLATRWQLKGRYKNEKTTNTLNQFVSIPASEQWLDLALGYSFSSSSSLSLGRNLIRKTTAGVSEWVVDGVVLNLIVDL